MRQIRYFLLIPLLAALPLLGLAVIAHAQSFRSGDTVTLPSGQTLNSTLFVAGRTLDIAGNINGDLFCAGENITVSGRVRGDVICAGQNLTVTGAVGGDVRLAGQSVTLDSQVDGNATIAAQSFVQQSHSTVTGDMTVGGQDASLNGHIGRDVAGELQTLTVNDTVGRDITASLERLRLNDGARIAGNVTYTSGNKLDRSPGAQVQGRVTRHTPAKQPQHHWLTPLAGWAVAVYLYVSCVLVAMVLALLVPGVFRRAAGQTGGRLGRTFLVGLVSSIVMPVVLMLLMATLIGIPLALLAGLAWLLAVLLAGPFAAYLLGSRILRGRHSAIVIMLVGSLILFALYLLPLIGWIFWLVGTWFGLGALLLQLHGFNRRSGEDAPAQPPAKA